MKKRVLTVGMLLILLSAKAQNNSGSDTTAYKPRKMKLEEVNFATSYYTQDGNNSAVTGGIGTEQLTDVATTINLNFVKYNKNNDKRSLNFELGVDVYSSASSDKIDPATISSASRSDQRIYPSINYRSENSAKRYSLGGGLSASSEFDYTSLGGNVYVSKTSKDKSREISATASAFFDTWRVILPVEYRSSSGYGSSPRNSYNLGLLLSQVVSREFQFAVLADISYQDGLLGTSFHRVYFGDGSGTYEKLPSSRFKIPLGFRTSYFLGDRMVLRTFYRYYRDNWEMTSHTASLELVYKITPFISVSPSYRFYRQTEAEYFAGYREHSTGEEFYTSDYDLSGFNSDMFGVNARFSNLNGKLGLDKLNTLELRYSNYQRSTGLSSNIVSMVLTFKK